MTRLRDIPGIGAPLWRLKRRLFPRRFHGSRSYWVERYAGGGNSGLGSYDELAEFKAEVLNAFVRGEKVRTVIEYGCGDGNQLGLAEYPSYTGFDVSPQALELCRARFKSDRSKSFQLLDEYSGERADLTLSLDVIYHLVEDHIFEEHMQLLFASADRFVIVYSSNVNENPPETAPHVRQRRFTDWVDSHQPGWSLRKRIPNRFPYDPKSGKGSMAEFFVYEKVGE